MAEVGAGAVSGAVEGTATALTTAAGQAVSTESVLQETTSAPFSGTLTGRRADDYIINIVKLAAFAGDSQASTKDNT